ncbi:MAG: hypothetical protein WCZ47_00595 [Bacilli bacterium]|jgi:steroid 5-alpha reductase family enzyme|nr:hypothetical protein [Bacilli bacterium]NLN80726.1 hypothetical protein [Erysipelotrichia bacterium]
MKDKLVKYHRRAPYYRMRKFIIVFSLFAVAAIAISIPITIQIATRQAQANQNDTQEVVHEK